MREAQLEQFNYILVVGKDEADHGTVNVRTRDNKRHGTKTLEQVRCGPRGRRCVGPRHWTDSSGTVLGLLQLIQEFKELELNYTKDSAISDPGGEPADAE